MPPKRANLIRATPPVEAGPSISQPSIQPTIVPTGEKHTPEEEDEEDEEEQGTQLDRESPAREEHTPAPGVESETQELLRRRAALVEILRNQRLK